MRTEALTLELHMRSAELYLARWRIISNPGLIGLHVQGYCSDNRKKYP